MCKMASSPASLDESPLPSPGEPAATNSNEPSLGASVADSPLFKLPPELRNRIYGYVFGAEEVMSPDIPSSHRALWANQWQIHGYDSDADDSPHPDPEIAVQTSILAVCRVVKAEAIEVLYDTKILRGGPIDLDIMLQSDDVSSRVRRIELTRLLECIQKRDHYEHKLHSRHLRHLLMRLQCLPRLNSILMLSDCLTAKTEWLDDSWISVMEFVEEAELEPATCVDIGRYQLHGKFKNIQIVNSKLVKLWPAVRDTPEDYNGVEQAMAIIESIQSSIDVANIAAWASHTSLRCWVDVQQRFLALNVSGEWDRLINKASTMTLDDDENHSDDAFTFDFFMHAALNPVRLSIGSMALLRSGEHVMKQLQPNDSSDVLDEVSQFLALNIALYNHYNDHPSVDRYELREIVWKVEERGIEKTRLEYMAEQQSIALSAGASKHFILDPSANYNIPACNLIPRRVFVGWIEEFDLMPWIDGTAPSEAPPLQTKQLTYLHLAALQPFSLKSDDQHRRDEWSKSLIMRYMMASGRLSQEVVERTSLNDLRTIMSIVLDIFDADRSGDGRDWLLSLSHDLPAPADFDTDVYPGLGWNYGKLLAQAFERYTSQGRVSKSLARQWVKESTLWS